jgi:hypothetical protein
VESNADLSGGRRWVLVGPKEGRVRLLFGKAVTDEQRASVGQQGGGRVFSYFCRAMISRAITKYFKRAAFIFANSSGMKRMAASRSSKTSMAITEISFRKTLCSDGSVRVMTSL